MSWNSLGTLLFIFASSVITSRISRPVRLAISKSFGSCAGVTFTKPDPNSGSTCSSATTGILRPVKGSSMLEPINDAYRSSSGCTATPVSPSIVSGRVVETVKYQRPSSKRPTASAPASTEARAASAAEVSNGYRRFHSLPSLSCPSASSFESAVWHLGHQLMMYSPR